MKMSECAGVVAACVIGVTPFVSTSASAGGMDGSSDIVCSAVDVIGCAEEGGCVQGTAWSFDLPDLMIVDAGKKVIRGTHEDGHKAVSPIKHMERSSDHLLLQGVENGRGWNLAINTKTGRLSASVVGDAVSFLVFGACASL